MDVLRDWVVAVGAIDGFRAGVAAPSCLGGSLGGLRFSCVASGFAGASEGLRFSCVGCDFVGAIEDLRGGSKGVGSEGIAEGLSSLFFGGSFAGFFGGGFAGWVLGVSLLADCAGCFAGSFLGGCLAAGFAGVLFLSTVFESPGLAAEVATSLGAAVDFGALLGAGEAVVLFLGPSLGGFLLGVSDMIQGW